VTRPRSGLGLVAVLMALALVAAACGGGGGGESPAAGSGDSGGAASAGDSGGAASGEVNISGSSTVEPVSVRVAELFESVNPDVVVNVDGPGTGDGFVLFCDGETDISDASRAIKDSEAETCASNGIEYVELNIGIDGLAVMTGPGNPLECVNFADLYALTGPESTGFRNWKDAQALASELGSSTEFPDAPLDIYGPGEESGTFDTFVEFVIDKPAEERGQDGTTRPDYNANADDNVIVQGVESSDTSLGWVGFAYAENAPNVKLLKVDGGDGNCVAPTAETIASGEYPLSRPLFIYPNTARVASNPAVKAYVDFYMADGLDKAVAEVGYVALSDEAKAKTRAAWEAVS